MIVRTPLSSPAEQVPGSPPLVRQLTRSRLAALTLVLCMLPLAGCGPQVASSDLAPTSTPGSTAVTATPQISTTTSRTAITSASVTPAITATEHPIQAISPTVTDTAPVIGPVVATVNGVAISGALYKVRLAYYEATLQSHQQVNFKTAQGEALLPRLRSLILQRLIDQEVIHQYAQSHHLTVTTATVNHEVSTLIARNGGQVPYTRMLATSALTDPEFHQLVGEELESNNVFALVTKDIPTTTVQVHARHILVGTRALAESILRQLQHGGSFAALARKYSLDKGSAVVGGDLGFFGAGVMVKPFSDLAFSLKDQQIGGPVQTQYGFHIIQVLAHKIVPISAQTLSQQRNAAITTWLQTQRNAAKIDKILNV